MKVVCGMLRRGITEKKRGNTMRRLGTILVLGALSLSLLSGCGDKTGYAKDGFAEGRLGDTMHTYFFDFTVNSAYLCDTYEGYTPIMEGYQLLVADVTVKNTNRESIPMYDTDFQVQWSDDSEDAYDVPITYYTDAVSDQQLPTEYELAVDEERTGLLVFEVPAGETDFSISYLELFDDGTEEGEEGDTFFVYFTAEAQA